MYFIIYFTLWNENNHGNREKANRKGSRLRKKLKGEEEKNYEKNHFNMLHETYMEKLHEKFDQLMKRN